MSKKIIGAHSDMFALSFDGGFFFQTHHFYVFAIIPSREGTGRNCVMLAFFRFENEQRLAADAYVDVLEFVLSVLKEKWEYVDCLNRQNCSTKKSLTSNLSYLCLVVTAIGSTLLYKKF